MFCLLVMHSNTEKLILIKLKYGLLIFLKYSFFLQVLDFLLFVGKFILTFLLTAISFFVFSSKPLGLTYPWVPTVIVALITWLISASFFGVYTAAVDTLFLSFCKYDVKVIARKIYVNLLLLGI